MSDERRCRGIETAGARGGTRFISGCPRPPLASGDLCIVHQQEADYRQGEFERMLTFSTRHSPRVKYGQQGTFCSCGKFIDEGDLHPWGVPGVVEDHLEELLRRVPLTSYSPVIQEAVGAFHRGGSHPVLEQLAEECRAIAREERTGT